MILEKRLEELSKNTANCYSDDYVVVRCVIPAGSKYYKGEVYTGCVDEVGLNGELPEGYCSNAIIIKEVLKND